MLVNVRVGSACVAFVALFSALGSAQLPSCPNSGSTVARPCELDEPLTERGRIRPYYPDILRQAGVAGEVLLRYMVDTNGRALPASAEVIRSTHDLFTTAVKNSMPRQRFEPPRRAGILANVAVEELVRFAVPRPGWTSHDREPVTRRTADSTGRLLTTIYAFTPRDSAHAPVLTNADSLAIYEAVLDELTRIKLVQTPPAAWCVQLDGRTPASQMLVRWRRNGRRVVGVADCPRTYTTMIRTPNAPEPPRGWIDPVAIAADSMVSWAEDTVLLTTRTSQGTVSTTSNCEVVRVAGTWKASCVNTEWRIS